MNKKFCLATLVGAVLFIFDRITRTLAFHHAATDIIPKVLKSLPTNNFGIALGISISKSQASTIIIGLLLLIIVVALAYWAYKTKNFYAWLSMNLIFFGAFSNLLDRLAYGSVRDFLKFSFWPTTNNLGDLMVTLGAIILIITYHPNTKNIPKT
jgi:signal peptidase II